MTVPPSQFLASDREQAVTLLVESRRALRTLCDSLAASDWQQTRSTGAWTPLDIVEHLVLSERAVLALVRDDLARRPALPPERRTRVRDLAVLLAVTNRDQRFQAAEIVTPRRSFAAPKGALEAFDRDRDATIGYVRRSSDDLRARLFDHPVLGEIDAYQWLLFLGAHTERHTAQLRETIARASLAPQRDRRIEP